MDYIINPRWFYWVSVADTLRTVCILSVIPLIVFVLLLLFVYQDSYSTEKDIKHVKIWVLVFSIIFLIGIFIPSKEVLYQMMIARIATKQNITLTMDAVKQVVDYIVDAFSKIK